MGELLLRLLQVWPAGMVPLVPPVGVRPVRLHGVLWLLLCVLQLVLPSDAAGSRRVRAAPEPVTSARGLTTAAAAVSLPVSASLSTQARCIGLA
jgi:hypothetical protein